jgi:signal transduction histidine kinase
MLLESVRETHKPALEGICEVMMELFGDSAVGAAVVEKSGEEFVVQAHAGLSKSPTGRWPCVQSFAGIVMDQNRTAYVEDLVARPDLKLPNGYAFRSILATPLRLNESAVGAVEIYAASPQKWTTQHFKMIEWIAAQCSLIWEARRLRDEMAKANATLERLVNDRTGKLQELVDELEHFSYTITHDMRAPLRAMQGYAGILEEECQNFPNEECKDYLRRITTAAGRMDRLITDALNYSKAVRQEMTLAPVDTLTLLRGIIESYPGFQPPQAQIDLEGHFPMILANEAGLTQCFSNLLNNAVKFVECGQQPQIKIRAEQKDEHVRLWFEDNGIGIGEDMQPRIFGMFQRASKDFEGTGIGLALVKKVTERMAGRIGVESEIGKGSRFWIELKPCK